MSTTPAWRSGATLIAGLLQECELIAPTYAIEPRLQARYQPQFLSSMPPELPDAGIGSMPAAAQVRMAQLRTAAAGGARIRSCGRARFVP